MVTNNHACAIMVRAIIARAIWVRALILILAAIPFTAQAEATSPQGVWEGAIGDKAIVACFNKFSWGSYYYLDHLKPIQLTTSKSDQSWHEGDMLGKWNLLPPKNGTLTGTWFSALSIALPIKLTRIDGQDDSKACARDSYNLRLETPPIVETGKVIKFSPTRSYRKIRFAGQETVELLGADPALNKINAAIKIDKSKQAVNAHFQQKRNSLAMFGRPIIDERVTMPEYWDENFITINFHVWTAHHGRSGIYNTFRTWNTKTGKEVDLWQWIGASAKNPTIPPKLKKFMVKGIKTQQQHATKGIDCSKAYRGKDDYIISLDKKGLHFSEEAWGNGCALAFFMTFKQLSPFLTQEGKKAANAIAIAKQS